MTAISAKQTYLDSYVNRLAQGHSSNPPPPPVQSATQKVCDVTGKVAIGGIALASKFPYIAPNLQLPLPFALRVSCATANFISWLAFEWDVGFKIIDQVIQKRSEEEIQLHKEPSKNESFFKSACQVAAVGIACLSQLPSAFQAITFNSKDLAGPIAAVTIGATAIFPTRSMFLSIDEFFNLRNSDKELSAKRDKLLHLIESNQKHFENLSEVDQKKFITELEAISNGQNPAAIKKEYLTKLLSEQVSETLPEKPLSRTVLDVAATASGLFLMGCYEYFNADYTLSGTKLYLYDNDILAGAMAGVVVLSTSYLTGLTIVQLTRDFFHGVADSFEKDKPRDLVQKSYGKTERTWQVLTSITSLLSVGAYFEVVRQYYKNDPFKQLFFEVTACLPIFFFLQASANNFIRSQIFRWGFKEETQQKILKISSDYAALGKLVKEMDPQNLPLFSSLLSNEQNKKIGFPIVIDEEAPVVKEDDSEKDKEGEIKVDLTHVHKQDNASVLEMLPIERLEDI